MTFLAKTCIQNVVPKLSKMCNKEPFHKYNTLFEESYHPELDTSDFCDADNISKYKSLLGSANWVITLGHCDITYAVNTLLHYTMAPCPGHCKAMEGVFGYLRQSADGHIILDQ